MLLQHALHLGAAEHFAPHIGTLGTGPHVGADDLIRSRRQVCRQRDRGRVADVARVDPVRALEAERLRIVTVANRVEAELARLNLEAEGIDAILFDADMHSFGWGPIVPIRLMVLEEDLADARRLLPEL